MKRNTLGVILLLVALVAVIGLFLSGTVGVSSTHADRTLQGNVADDSHAYFGSEITATENNGTVDIQLIITNNVPDDDRVSEVIVRNDEGQILKQVSDVPDSGELSLETDTIECGDQLHIDVRGKNSGAELARTVECS